MALPVKTTPQRTKEQRVARQARLARVALIVGPLAGIAGAAYMMRQPKAAAAAKPVSPAPTPASNRPKAFRGGWHRKKVSAVRFVPRKPPANTEDLGVKLKDLPKTKPLVAAPELPPDTKNYTQIKPRHQRILKDHTKGMMRVPKIKISTMGYFGMRLRRINARLFEFALPG